MIKSLILYWSLTGNTESVAKAIKGAIEKSGNSCEIFKINQDLKADWFDYDLVLVGSPVYEFLPPQNVANYLKGRFHYYRDEKKLLKPSSPKLKRKFVLTFCTYGGPHTGIREAIPAVEYTEQFFEHLGFFVLEPILTVGSFRGDILNGKFGYTKELCDRLNKSGRLGDITNRPNPADLAEVENKIMGSINAIKPVFGL